mgnify:CR=1 FL=1
MYQATARLAFECGCIELMFDLVLQEHQPETFIECCAMQLAIMLEPALVSPSPAPVRLLSSIMRRLVRWECVCGGAHRSLPVVGAMPGVDLVCFWHLQPVPAHSSTFGATQDARCRPSRQAAAASAGVHQQVCGPGSPACVQVRTTWRGVFCHACSPPIG